MSKEVKEIVQRLRGCTVVDDEVIKDAVKRSVELGVAATVAVEHALTGKLGFSPLFTQSQVSNMIAEARQELEIKHQGYIKRHYNTKAYVAKQWLLKTLTKPMKVADLKLLAKEANQNWFIVTDAKEELCVLSVKPSRDGGWIWYPPEVKDKNKSGKKGKRHE